MSAMEPDIVSVHLEQQHVQAAVDTNVKIAGLFIIKVYQNSFIEEDTLDKILEPPVQHSFVPTTFDNRHFQLRPYTDGLQIWQPDN